MIPRRSPIAVAVGVLERARIDLVDHRVLPPLLNNGVRPFVHSAAPRGRCPRRRASRSAPASAERLDVRDRLAHDVGPARAACRCRTGRGRGRRTRARSAARAARRRAPCRRRSGGSSRAARAAAARAPGRWSSVWILRKPAREVRDHRAGVVGHDPQARVRLEHAGVDQAAHGGGRLVRPADRPPDAVLRRRLGRVVGPRRAARRVQPDRDVELLRAREQRREAGVVERRGR